MINKKAVSIFVNSLLCLTPFFFGAFLFISHTKIIDFSPLEQSKKGKASILLDDEGNEWGRFAFDRRQTIYYNQIPQQLINALIATEDWDFFKHHGLSYKGILRSIIVNLYHGRRAQGASTITQQLVRLLFFDAKKTITRKIKEQIVALLVERQFTKEQIIEKYLNHVYFGCGIYGIQAAAKRFWNKDVSSLSLIECATLVGIVCSPSRYCPLISPLSCKKRRNIVLLQMKKLGFITSDYYHKAVDAPLTLHVQKNVVIAPYLRESIRIFMQNLIGKKQLYTGGYVIQTTLNCRLQKYAQDSFDKQMLELKQKFSNDIQGGLISLDVQTGSIKALIGGVDFAQSQFNRAFQAKRQIGSVFKPFLYAAAIKQGYSFADVDSDELLQIEQAGSVWCPKNWDRKYLGTMTLAHALTTSRNTISVKTFLNVGAQSVLDIANKCYFTEKIVGYPSLALGCTDQRLSDVAGAFNIFASNGMYHQPHYIKWVKNQFGSKIFKHEQKSNKVLDSYISGQVTKVLELGLKRVKNILPQKWIDSQAISKTGTTNDSRTCWFAGSTPQLTTVVYVGYDDNRPMGRWVYPIRTAFPIWIGMHNKMISKKKKFIYNQKLKKIYINKLTGKQEQKGYSKDTIAIMV